MIIMLITVPLINIIAAPSKSAINMKDKAFLYNMDFMSRWVASLLYPLGISTDPEQVIIGKDDWLYLGDRHELTLSNDKRVATEADLDIGKQIGSATKAWDAYLAGKGVKIFRIMVGPNKGSIYPEHMPLWAKPVPSNPTDVLFSEAGEDILIDLRKPLLAAKKTRRETLYYKTDTHWNALGAGAAFQAFAKQAGKADPELQWPSEKTYEHIKTTPRNGGDLANFLRLTANLSDEEQNINWASLPVETAQVDFATKQIISKGGNPPVGAPQKPLLVKSVGALNNKRVLWLRDSFGSAMSPLMAATFSDVLQLHWGPAISQGGNFARLVDEFKPDYVFVTVVERAVRHPGFASYPPPALVPKGKDFQEESIAVPAATNHLVRGTLETEYKINGNDAFVDFALSSTDTKPNAQYLNIDLTCSDGSQSVPLQLFWMNNGMTYYDEEHSVRLSLHTGQTLIDLRTIPKWPFGMAVKRVRVDIDAVNSCANFKLSNITFGFKKR